MNAQIEKIVYSAKEKKYYTVLSYKKIMIESEITHELAQAMLKKGIKKILTNSKNEVHYQL